jgi:hypothetical protein
MEINQNHRIISITQQHLVIEPQIDCKTFPMNYVGWGFSSVVGSKGSFPAALLDSFLSASPTAAATGATSAMSAASFTTMRKPVFFFRLRMSQLTERTGPDPRTGVSTRVRFPAAKVFGLGNAMTCNLMPFRSPLFVRKLVHAHRPSRIGMHPFRKVSARGNA